MDCYSRCADWRLPRSTRLNGRAGVTTMRSQADEYRKNADDCRQQAQGPSIPSTRNAGSRSPNTGANGASSRQGRETVGRLSWRPYLPLQRPQRSLCCAETVAQCFEGFGRRLLCRISCPIIQRSTEPGAKKQPGSFCPSWRAFCAEPDKRPLLPPTFTM
jgi:hypothetical protein